MKSVFLGLCLMVIVSAAAWFVMGNERQSAAEYNTSKNDSVRLD